MEHNELKARHTYLLSRYHALTILPHELRELQSIARKLRHTPESKVDTILRAVEQTGLLEDYQLSNLAEFLEDELRQKASRY